LGYILAGSLTNGIYSVDSIPMKHDVYPSVDHITC
jgi:hypothetical protein